jgi:hypothetical protein
VLVGGNGLGATTRPRAKHAGSAPAGQAAPAALPPGSPLIGRPENNAAAAKLAPVPAPPLPTSFRSTS